MCADSTHRKSGSPQSCTESASLSLNRLKNKEALEKGLRCRRSIKELVNQGILLNPSISNADKVRQLQRAKTSDTLKQKIERRPDRQYLVNRRIIRDEKPGTSPFILQQCHNLEKHQLKSTLNSKLIARPGTLELIEKGVLQVDPGITNLIRHGSIQYPRVGSVNRCVATTTGLEIPAPPPTTAHNSTPLPLTLSASNGPCSKFVGRSKPIGSRSSSYHPISSRSIRDETVVYRVGSLVFHNYCPKSSPPAFQTDDTVTLSHQKQKARETQQAEMLRLQDTARVHRLVEQELSCRIGLGTTTLMDPPDVLTFDTCNSPEWQSVDSLTPSLSVKLTSSVNSPFSSSFSEPAELARSFQPEEHRTFSSDISVKSPVVCTSTSASFSLTDATTTSTTLYTRSLERLSATKLRTECRERNLTRSGSKAALIRQLEPYRDEILAKYFNDGVSDLRCHNSLELDSSHKAFLSLSVHGGHLPTHPIIIQSFPPPTWTVARVSFSQETPTLSTTNTTAVPTAPANLFLCPANSTSIIPALPISTMHSIASPIFLLISNSTSAYEVQPLFCYSQPISRLTTADSHPIPQRNILTESYTASSSVVPAFAAIGGIPEDSIPNTFTSSSPNTTLSFSCASCLSYPHSVCPSHIPASIQQSTNFTPTPNLYAPFGRSLPQLFDDNEPSHSNPMRTPLMKFENCPVASHSPSTLSEDVHLDGRRADSSVTSPSGCSSLRQIEDVWLRIRQLRRCIAKLCSNADKTHSIEPADHSANPCFPPSSPLDQLVQEHDRLAVLCRLLVIERIDALDEVLEANVNSGRSDFALISGDSAFRLQMERSLMDSYLHKLGGSSLVKQISSPSMRLHCSSSPFSHPTEPFNAHSHRETQTFSTSTTADPSALSNWSNCATVSRTSDLTVGPPIGATEYLPISLPDAISKANSSSLDRLPHYNDKTRFDAVHANECASCEPPEPPPSPMTTDVLFELWNGVLKDTSCSDRISAAASQNHLHLFRMGVLNPHTSRQLDAEACHIVAVRDSNLSPLQDFCCDRTVHSAVHPLAPDNIGASNRPPSVITLSNGVLSTMDADAEPLQFSMSLPSVHKPSEAPGYTLGPSAANNSSQQLTSQMSWHSFVQSHARNLVSQPGVSPPSFTTATLRPSVSPTAMADALFTSLDNSEFTNLMDTNDPYCGVSLLP